MNKSDHNLKYQKKPKNAYSKPLFTYPKNPTPHARFHLADYALKISGLPVNIVVADRIKAEKVC
ncbi:hypothetical protein ABRP83_13765 [Pectobacterium brasiliense]|uniref:hypothetical protein n=1 Tax=Pectobacterium brasiliense TaxID=180957 RepID=UPI0032ECC5D8